MSDQRSRPKFTPIQHGNSDSAARHPGFWVRDGIRVDHPATSPDPQSPFVLTSSDAPQVDYDTVQAPETPDPVPTSRFASHRTEPPLGDPLLQSRQIAEYVQRRNTDLNRREQRLNAQLAELDQERRTFRMWMSECEAVLLRRDEELQLRETECAKGEESYHQVEQELETRRSEVEQRERELADQQQFWHHQLENERAKLQDEIDQQRLALQHEQAQFTGIKESQLAEIQQERTLSLNRIRFQEDHLRKLQQEFETTQEEFHREKQQIQTKLLAAEEQSRLRFEQLQHFRGILNERENAIHRQLSALAKTRRSSLDSLDRILSEFENEKSMWHAERDRKQAELDRKSEILKLNAENLESRQQRLEQLRTELEETHRKTLEMRLAIEEACGQLNHAIGRDVAQQRITAAQDALTEHYQIAREMIQRQRMDVEHFQNSVIEQRNEFRAEQQSVSEWIAHRDEELRVRESNLASFEQQVAERERAWQQSRELWLQEKLEAETTIRELLRRLEQQHVIQA